MSTYEGWFQNNIVYIITIMFIFIEPTIFSNRFLGAKFLFAADDICVLICFDNHSKKNCQPTLVLNC